MSLPAAGAACRALALVLTFAVLGCTSATTPSPTTSGGPASPPPAASAPGPSAAEATPAPSEAGPASAGPAVPSATHAVRREGDIPFTRSVPCGDSACQLLLDVYAPKSPSTGLPVFVLVGDAPGGPGARSVLGSFAFELAGRGAVVFLADYRGIGSGGGFPQTIEDVGCAVRFARARAGVFGGDGFIVTLAGHGLGGHVALVAALSAERYPDTGCIDSGDPLSNSVVPIGGRVRADPLDPGYAELLGGSPTEQPTAWAGFDASQLLGTELTLVVRLVNGDSEDPGIVAEAQAFDAELIAAGYDSEAVVVPGADHATVVDPDGAGDATLDLLIELAGG